MQSARVPSFYQPVDGAQRDALLAAYIDYLNERNGPIDPATGQLPKREASLAAMNQSDIRYAGQVSQQDFDRLYQDFSARAPELSRALLLVLLFSKMHAGEAYGVRVVKKTHAGYNQRHQEELPI